MKELKFAQAVNVGDVWCALQISFLEARVGFYHATFELVSVGSDTWAGSSVVMVLLQDHARQGRRYFFPSNRLLMECGF